LRLPYTFSSADLFKLQFFGYLINDPNEIPKVKNKSSKKSNFGGEMAVLRFGQT